MKRKIIASCLSLAMMATQASARDLEEIRQSGTLMIATEAYFAPFAFYEGETLTGFEVDVANAIAAKMGLTPEWTNVGFDALLTGLQQGRWDWVVASMTPTPERLEAADWVAPHYCSGMVGVGRPEVVTAEGMTGTTAAAQTGSVYIDRATTMGIFGNLVNFPQDTDARMAMMSGRADVWLTDALVAAEAVAANPDAGIVASEVLVEDRVASAVQKGNADLAAALSTALSAVIADGTYAEISQRWFGSDISCK